MIEGRRGARFAQQTLLVRGCYIFGGEKLQRHRPLQLQVGGLVDHTHAASAEAAEHLVTADAGGLHGCCCLRHD